MAKRSIGKRSAPSGERSPCCASTEDFAPSSSAKGDVFEEGKPVLKGEAIAPEPEKALKRRRGAGGQESKPQAPKREARFRKQLFTRGFMVHRSGQDPAVAEISETFNVLGSTGNVYTVEMKTRPTCDCPDNLKGNSPCKHILFIFLKVLKVPIPSGIWYQKALLPDELAQVFASAPASNESTASDAVQKAFRKATGAGDVEEDEPEEALMVRQPAAGGELQDETGPGGRRLTTIGDDCPICFEEMSKTEFEEGMLVFDVSLGGCGKPLHAVCFQMWSQSAVEYPIVPSTDAQKSKGSASTCVWCRTPWVVPAEPGKGKGKVAYTKTGYMNMASVAGMSGVRDTSTYYHHFVKGGKGKTWADVYAEGDELM